jgi:hypothetical protein
VGVIPKIYPFSIYPSAREYKKAKTERNQSLYQKEEQ